jgi:carbamoyl-phosphate synthase large subunit
MQNKRVFVSGGAGVIGLEMVPRLVALGAIVMVGDLKARPKEFSPKVIYRQGDLNKMTEADFRSFAPDIFMHLAATFERSTESYEFWGENFQHNVHLSHHLMTLAKDAPSLSRVVFASSYLIYDPALYQFKMAREQPISLQESDPVSPRNLTGMAKLSNEIAVRFIDQFCANRLSTVCARIYRGYGRNSRDVISRWVRSLLRNEPITIYRPEGIFDYIYAADSAEGLIRLAAAHQVNGIINLGTGRSRRVQDVLDVLRQHFPNMQSNAIDSDISFEASQADISSLKQLVGWEPVYDLPQAIAEIIDFERARLDVDVMVTKLPLNVLVSSSAAKAPLVRAVQAAVRQIDPTGQVVAGDSNTQALTTRVADSFWAMPPTQDCSLDVVVSGLRQRHINIVLPTRDGELMFWSRHAARLRIEGVNVIVSNPEPLQRCLDKLEFARFGSANDLPFILTSEKLDDIPGECLVVKERFGAGSRSIGLRLDRVSALAHSLTLENPIFQPYVEGLEISIDAWLDRSCMVKGIVLRRRDNVINGESQVTTTFSDPSLEAQALHILQALQLSGPVVMQAMVSLDGELKIIECNPRFGGASTTSIAVGLSSLHWSLLEAVGANLSEWPFHRMSGQLRQIRMPTDFYIHDPT